MKIKQDAAQSTSTVQHPQKGDFFFFFILYWAPQFWANFRLESLDKANGYYCESWDVNFNGRQMPLNSALMPSKYSLHWEQYYCGRHWTCNERSQMTFVPTRSQVTQHWERDQLGVTVKDRLWSALVGFAAAKNLGAQKKVSVHYSSSSSWHFPDCERYSRRVAV